MVYVFALIAMLCWGISPIFAKLGLKDVNPMVGLSVRTFFTAAIIFMFLILSGGIEEFKIISAKTLVLLIIEAVLATLIGDFAYFAALKQGSASIVMLILAMSPIVTIICSVIFLNEHLTYTHVIGACFAIVGLILII